MARAVLACAWRWRRWCALRVCAAMLLPSSVRWCACSASVLVNCALTHAIARSRGGGGWCAHAVLLPLVRWCCLRRRAVRCACSIAVPFFADSLSSPSSRALPLSDSHAATSHVAMEPFPARARCSRRAASARFPPPPALPRGFSLCVFHPHSLTPVHSGIAVGTAFCGGPQIRGRRLRLDAFPVASSPTPTDTRALRHCVRVHSGGLAALVQPSSLVVLCRGAPVTGTFRLSVCIKHKKKKGARANPDVR